MKLLTAALVVALLGSGSFAQDPLKVLPKSYKLQFENEWVRVVRVYYAPNEKLAAHDHTQTATAYVYLNDSGPVVFNHVDKAYGKITRPATKAGSFRLYRGLQEIHEVENKSDLPSDFLRVEFKTNPVGDRNLKGRYYREDYPKGENFLKVQFENEQIRVARLVCAPGKRIQVASSASEPALLIALVPAQLKAGQPGGKARDVKLGPGQPRFVAINQREELENVGAAPAELLRFDFKTKPVSKDAAEQKKHEHPKN